MEVPGLDAEELAAIRDAISTTPTRDDDDVDAAPLSLIADDRAAITARPSASKIAERWQALLSQQLRRLLGPDTEISTLGADAVDGQSLRDRVEGMWTCSLQPIGHIGGALVGVSGPLIEMVAARLLGDPDGAPDPTRTATATALKLFNPVGKRIATALAQAWNEQQGFEVRFSTDRAVIDEIGGALFDSEMVIALQLALTGDIDGRMICLAKPDTLVAPPRPFEAVPAPEGAIDEALGAVPVQVRVDYGSTQITARQLAELAVGAVIPLGAFIDDQLPVECAGVVKALGTVVVHRGVLSIEITRLTSTDRKAA